MKLVDDGVFTVPELAKYLRMKPITIYKHVAGGKLPGFKVGSKWRFKRESIDLWIRRQEETSFKPQGVYKEEPS